MRAIPALNALFLTLALSTLHAQDGAAPKPAENPAPDAKPQPAAEAEKEAKIPASNMSTFGPGMKLSSLPSRYVFLLSEAMKRFQVRDYMGAEAYADKADEILPPTTWSLNVRGAVAIEQRDFERGYKYCADALKLEPGFFAARFNLCEIPFLQGKYAEARGLWMKLFDQVAIGDKTKELLTYRIFLTYLLERNTDRAKEWMEKLPFPSQTPAYDYAHAAWEHEYGSQAKWEERLRSAAYIWPESKRSEYTDVLIQLGWMKRE